MKIYFAGAISGGRDDQAIYLEIVGQLRTYGCVLTEHIADPLLDKQGEAASRQSIHDRDLSWLKQADCLVAEVTMPSLGVGYEIGRMSEWGKRILCLYRPTPPRALSAMIAGCGAVSVREYQSTAELKEIFDDFFGRAK